jgi:hypothetical protein
MTAVSFELEPFDTRLAPFPSVRGYRCIECSQWWAVPKEPGGSVSPCGHMSVTVVAPPHCPTCRCGT